MEMSQRTPLLTIAIPTYSRAEKLARLLDSIVMESESVSWPIEIVVSDNASTDDTPRVANVYLSKESIKYSRNPTNLGFDRNLAAVVGLWQRWRDLSAFGRSLGLSTLDRCKFVRTRGLSRIVPAPNGTVAIFLPTYPLTHLNEDWFLEIEDTTTVFDPYALNGRTRDVRFRELKVFPLIRQLLESPRCLGILTHARSTQAGVSTLFQSDTIANKTVSLAPAYVPTISVVEDDLDSGRVSRPVRFFFNNFWHQAHGVRDSPSVQIGFGYGDERHVRKRPWTLRLRPSDLSKALSSPNRRHRRQHWTGSCVTDPGSPTRPEDPIWTPGQRTRAPGND